MVLAMMAWVGADRQASFQACGACHMAMAHMYLPQLTAPDRLSGGHTHDFRRPESVAPAGTALQHHVLGRSRLPHVVQVDAES